MKEFLLKNYLKYILNYYKNEYLIIYIRLKMDFTSAELEEIRGLCGVTSSRSIYLGQKFASMPDNIRKKYSGTYVAQAFHPNYSIAANDRC